MRIERPETIAGADVVLIELTLNEIRQWMVTISAADASAVVEPVDVVDAMLFEDFDVLDVLMLTKLTKDDLGGMTPSQIEAVHARCKAINARFFSMRDLLAEIGRKAQAIPQPIS